ncbi:MAG: protein kinase [Candidatus Riflebacteria bacterium]|nr:protein kinase [Candidatus Riflebacteria bacterium]
MPQEKLPATFGRYEVRGELGVGGMGVVLRGHDPKLRRDVAIKVVPAHLRAVPTVPERLRREALVLARLSHPNIVRVFDAGDESGFLYYVMELLEGTPLDARTPETPSGEAPPPPPRFELDEFLGVFARLADALHAVHKQGLVHRDVKPANILAGVPERGAVLTDFGLAWVQDNSQLTREGQIVGTGRYMAPEQLAGAQPDALCDLYGLGASMFEFVTGAVPFHQARGARQVIAARLHSTLPPVASVVPGLPPAVATAIDRCVENDPARRFPSARDLHRALVRTGRDLGATATPSELLARSATGSRGTRTPRPPAAEPRPSERPSRLPARWPRSVSGMLAVAVLVLAIAATALAVRHWRSTGPSPVAVAPSLPAANRSKPFVTPGPVPARKPMLLGGQDQGASRVALAACGATRGASRNGPGQSSASRSIGALAQSSTGNVTGTLLAVWVTQEGGLAARVTTDGGATWSRPPLDGAVRAALNSPLALAAAGGRYHLFYAGPTAGERSRVGVRTCSVSADATAWTTPLSLKPSIGPSSSIWVAAQTLPGGQPRLLACWLTARATPAVLWGDGRNWTAAPSLTCPPGRVGAMACCLVGGEALVAWQQVTAQGENADIFMATWRGPQQPWSRARPLVVRPPEFDGTRPADQAGLPVEFSDLLGSEARERGLPVLVAAGDVVRAQWSEKYFLTGRRLTVMTSADRGRTFGRARGLGPWPANQRGSALVMRGNRLWSVWEDKVRGTTFWAASLDGGLSWTLPEPLGVFVPEGPMKVPALALEPAGPAWALWADLAGAVRVMKLP